MEEDLERKTILIVDDETNVRESLRMLLSRDFEVCAAASGDEALKVITAEQSSAAEKTVARPDLVLLDVMMPGLSGLDVLKQIKSEHPLLPVIMLTASKTVQTAVQAMKIGAVDYLNKPFDVDELLNLVKETLASGAVGRTAPSSVVTLAHSRPNLPKLPGDFGVMIGRHQRMQELFQRISNIAQRNTTVLITGESGTGKEIVAREVHSRSRRADKPFVALNCAAIPETLIESELFGHEKGSFTHAVEKRIGHFELADGGTLFLDEIGELGLNVQVKMLRFLQDQEFYRVGSSKPTSVDVRIIAATNRSLEKAIQAGSFRQDLYYRVNVVTLDVPPLRERASDIPALVDFFIERFSPLYGDRKPILKEEALEVLQGYAWPGNVRELENVMESLMALCPVDEIAGSDLPQRLHERCSDDGTKEERVLFEEAEAAFERDLILKALKKADFVQTRAAELLGISRRILKYKMDKLGISATGPSPHDTLGA